jgi:hypothetical protein
MQAALLLLHQYNLSHLQVRLLEAKEDLTFLQCPVEVGELFGPVARDTHLGEGVLLDSLNSDVTCVMFRVHLSKGALKGHQSILPCGNGTFSAIQLPLLGKELPLQLDDHRM